MTITEQLVEILQRPISDVDRQRAAHLLMDWIGCAVAGRKESAGEKMAAAFSEGSGPCTRIGSSKSTPLMASFHNGCLGNVLEMDDVDKRAVLHAGPTVIPAALAITEFVNADSRAFLDAIIKGYEATIRIGRAVGPGHYAFWHNTATCGPFGAAIAACHLLDDSDPVSALGLAGTQAAGLWQTRHEPESMAKQLHAGHAAHAGVLAAFLSQQGFQGPKSILEGEQGFFAAMCPGADPKNILKDYGDGWLIHQTSLKPYPSCRHAHPTIDAALQVEMGAGEILVETYSDAIKFCDRPSPNSVIEAKFSLQHSAAIALTKGVPELQDFELDRVAELADIRARIHVKESDEFQNAYPEHYGAAVTLAGERYFATDAYGDPENPLSEKAIIKKVKTLFQHAGEDKLRAMHLVANIAAFPLGGDILNFSDLLP